MVVASARGVMVPVKPLLLPPSVRSSAAVMSPAPLKAQLLVVPAIRGSVPLMAAEPVPGVDVVAVSVLVAETLMVPLLVMVVPVRLAAVTLIVAPMLLVMVVPVRAPVVLTVKVPLLVMGGSAVIAPAAMNVPGPATVIAPVPMEPLFCTSSIPSVTVVVKAPAPALTALKINLPAPCFSKFRGADAKVIAG